MTLNGCGVGLCCFACSTLVSGVVRGDVSLGVCDMLAALMCSCGEGGAVPHCIASCQGGEFASIGAALCMRSL